MDIVFLPAVQILLVAVIFFGFFVEIKTGGMGAGLIFAFIAAGVFFGSQYMEGLVNLYAVAVFIVGVACIIAEVAFPTVGLLGGVGVAAMLYSFVLALGADINAVYALLISLILAVIAFSLVAKRLPESKLWKKFMLSTATRTADGYVSAESRTELVGEVGKVLTELRPAGTVLLLGAPVDVVSEGAFIKKGKEVRVIAVNGSRVLVREVAE